MSLSNVIKNSDNSQFNIRTFDPEVISPGHDDTIPPSTGPKGSLRLPGGPPAGESKGPYPHEEAETPQDKAARLEREAYEKGFEQGRKDGIALEKKQLDEQRQQMETLFSEIRGLKATLLKEAEHDMITLCTLIAKRIVREEIRTDPTVIHRTIRAALDHVADGSRISISVHPEDMEEIRGILPELSSLSDGGQFQVVEDETLDRGGCILETGLGRINASIREQSASIESLIERVFNDALGEQK